MLREQGHWAHKNQEAYHGKRKGQTLGHASLPDIVCFTKYGHALLIEAKSTRGKSLPWDRLQPHQLEHLLDAYRLHPNFHAFIAVLFDDRKRTKDRHRRAFMVPVMRWEQARLTSGRLSLSVAMAADIGHELTYTPAQGWSRPTPGEQ